MPNQHTGPLTPIVRLLAQIERRGPDDCWPYTGGTVGDGYGAFWDGTKQTTASRAMLENVLGRALGPRERACHTCDNPPCCNPTHLFLGTQGVNLEDMRVKGRRGRTGPPGGQLDEAAVREIRQLYAARAMSQTRLAERFGVAQTTISRVIRRELWPHVE